MAFILSSGITIGNYGMRGGVHQVNIKRSVKEIIDTAIIEIPALGEVNANSHNEYPATSIETSKLFVAGDPVEIQLGYNGRLNTRFKGFVRRVTPTIPVQIECEGYAYQLRNSRLIKSWKSVSLKEFLKELIEGTDIVLSDNIPDYTLTNLCIKAGNRLKALEYVKQKIHLCVCFFFNVLYVGLEEGVKGKTVSLRLGWNTVRDDKLKYRLADDTEVMVRLVTGKGKSTKRNLIETGDKGGSLVQENIANITNPGDLQAIAKDLLKQSKYTGYEGYITAFLEPVVEPSDTANLIDKQYNEREGNYFVEGIEIDFGIRTRGATTKIHVGRSLSGAPDGH